MQQKRLDDLDLQLIHALQVEPRVAWNALAGILGSDPVTLARRWGRIEAEGLAWVSALGRSPHTGAAAIVEFTCAPGEALEVADRIAAEPAIYSIDLTAGRRDLLATLIVADDAELADFALGRLGSIPGVRSVRTHVFSGDARFSSGWTIQALRPDQVAAIPTPRAPRSGSAKLVSEDLANRLRLLLVRNGRASYADLGEQLGVSGQRVGDAISRLRRSGDLVLRTDVSAPASSWPFAAWYFIQAPAAVAALAQQALADLPAIQFLATATGPYNLIIAAAAQTKAQIPRFEEELERRLPRARIVDRSLVLRVHKHLGRRVDPSGRALDGPALIR